MLAHQTQDIILADHRFTTRHEIQVSAELLALGDDLVHVLEGQVVLMAVGAGPAALAMHVAGGGRVKQDQPRDIAVIFLSVLADHFCTAEKRLIAKVEKGHLRKIRIDFINHAVDKFSPAGIRIAEIRLYLRHFFIGKSFLAEVFLRQMRHLDI